MKKIGFLGLSHIHTQSFAKAKKLPSKKSKKWCPRAESNHRHEDFQSSALPTELPGHKTSDKVFIIKFN